MGRHSDDVSAGVMLVVYVLVPLMIVVAVSIVWNWRADRVGRDPVSSIDSFHRALEAMQPQSTSEDGAVTVDASSKGAVDAVPEGYGVNAVHDGYALNARHDGYATGRSEQEGDVLQAWG